MPKIEFSSDPYQNYQILLKHAIPKEKLNTVASEITECFETVREKSWMGYWKELPSSQPFESLQKVKAEDIEIPLENILAQFPSMVSYLSWDDSLKEFGVYHYSFGEHYIDDDAFNDISSEEEAIVFYKQHLQTKTEWKVVEKSETVVELLSRLIKNKPPMVQNLAFLLLFETSVINQRKQSLKIPYVEYDAPFGNQELYTQLMQNLFTQTGLSEQHLLLVDCLEFEGNHNDNEIWAILAKN